MTTIDRHADFDVTAKKLIQKFVAGSDAQMALLTRVKEIVDTVERSQRLREANGATKKTRSNLKTKSEHPKTTARRLTTQFRKLEKVRKELVCLIGHEFTPNFENIEGEIYVIQEELEKRIKTLRSRSKVPESKNAKTNYVVWNTYAAIKRNLNTSQPSWGTKSDRLHQLAPAGQLMMLILKYLRCEVSPSRLLDLVKQISHR